MIGRCSKTTFSSASSAKPFALVASVNARIDSFSAVPTSRNNSISGSVAKGTKAAFAFAVIGGQLSAEMVLASQASISEAIDSEILEISRC